MRARLKKNCSNSHIPNRVDVILSAQQYYGDTMEWAWTSAENERSRVVDLAKAQLAADADANIQNMKNDYNSSAAFGGLMTKFIGGALGF